MRHRREVRGMGRNAAERRAVMRGLALALIRHGKVRTTVSRAKALRPFVEPLVTRAKQDTVANRRTIAAKLPNPEAVKKLFTELGPRYADRKGGYTRVIKVSGFLRGDATVQAEVQWV